MFTLAQFLHPFILHPRAPILVITLKHCLFQKKKGEIWRVRCKIVVQRIVRNRSTFEHKNSVDPYNLLSRKLRLREGDLVYPRLTV